MKTKLQMNEHEKFLQQTFSFGVFASLTFVIYFVISSFTSTNNSSKHSRVTSNNFYTVPATLNGLQKGEYTPNTYLIQKQLFEDILQNSFLKNFSKFKGKQLESIFSKVAVLKA